MHECLGPFHRRNRLPDIRTDIDRDRAVQGRSQAFVAVGRNGTESIDAHPGHIGIAEVLGDHILCQTHRLGDVVAVALVEMASKQKSMPFFIVASQPPAVLVGTGLSLRIDTEVCHLGR